MTAWRARALPLYERTPPRVNWEWAEAGLTRRVLLEEGTSVSRICLPYSEPEEVCESTIAESLSPWHPLSMAITGRTAERPWARWWRAILAGLLPSSLHVSGTVPIRSVDLFSSTGGMTLGVRLLAAETGRRHESVAAVDTDYAALMLHRANHNTERLIHRSVESLVDYGIEGTGEQSRFAYRPGVTRAGKDLNLSGIDLVLAGPPCQGHSNLNNHSRRSDDRNHYYLTAVAFAIAVEATALIIENVPGVQHDRFNVVGTALTLLSKSGYRAVQDVLRADEMGWPQTRSRHFLVARKQGRPVPLADVTSALRAPFPRSVLWAIGGGQGLSHDEFLHEKTNRTDLTRDRIDELFESNTYNLKKEYRPPSHRHGHTYGSSYGRMHPHKPAPTITTGFTTPGRGRFIHPTKRRTITPAEAARLQGFPDTYKWRPSPDSPDPTRTQLATWIGDAVPLPLGYAAAMSALGPDLLDKPPKAADRDTKAA